MTDYIKCPNCKRLVDKYVFVYIDNEDLEIEKNDRIAYCFSCSRKCGICLEYWDESDVFVDCESCGLLTCPRHHGYCDICEEAFCNKCITPHFQKELKCENCGKDRLIIWDGDMMDYIFCKKCFKQEEFDIPFDELLVKFYNQPPASCFIE